MPSLIGALPPPYDGGKLLRSTPSPVPVVKGANTGVPARLRRRMTSFDSAMKTGSGHPDSATMMGCCGLGTGQLPAGIEGRAYGSDDDDLGRGIEWSDDEGAGPKGFEGGL
jgi:hypothetical protein